MSTPEEKLARLVPLYDRAVDEICLRVEETRLTREKLAESQERVAYLESRVACLSEELSAVRDASVREVVESEREFLNALRKPRRKPRRKRPVIERMPAWSL